MSGLINISSTSNSLTGVVPLSSVSNTTPTVTELAVQAAGYLGYLDLLEGTASQTPPPANLTDITNEITRVVGILNQLDGTTPPSPGVVAPNAITSSNDSQIFSLIQAGVTAAGVSATNYRLWWTSPDSSGSSPATQVMSWLGDVNTTNSGSSDYFNPASAQPDTIFALTMLMCDTQTFSAGQIGASTSVDSFFGQTNLMGSSSSEIAQFLNVYLNTYFNSSSNPLPSVTLIQQILPADSSDSMPAYDEFYHTDLMSSFPGSTLSLPSSMAPYVTSDMMDYWYDPLAAQNLTSMF